jgi:hypothetical protein
LGEAVNVTDKSASAVTVCVSVCEVLGLKLPSPMYSAVIECVIAESDEVRQIACPEALSGT